MNDVNIVNQILGSILLVGFGIRYFLPARNKLSMHIGSRTLIVFIFLTLYAGLLLASIGKLTYASVFISAITYGFLYIGLSFTLSRMTRNR
jgi:hypothetical protein